MSTPLTQLPTSGRVRPDKLPEDTTPMYKLILTGKMVDSDVIDPNNVGEYYITERGLKLCEALWEHVSDHVSVQESKELEVNNVKKSSMDIIMQWINMQKDYPKVDDLAAIDKFRTDEHLMYPDERPFLVPTKENIGNIIEVCTAASYLKLVDLERFTALRIASTIKNRSVEELIEFYKIEK